MKYGPDVLDSHPRLAVYVANVVAHSSLTELTRANILAVIAHADPRAARAMHSALNSTKAQKDVFEAVASVRMSEEARQLYNAVKKAIKGYSATRNNFCHHIWAESPAFPDALLLADPMAFAKFRANIQEPIPLKIARMKETPDDYETFSLDRSKIFVYGESELKEALATMRSALDILSKFEAFVSLESLARTVEVVAKQRDKAREQLVQALQLSED